MFIRKQPVHVVGCGNTMKHVNILCGQNAEIFNAIEYDIYTYHRALIYEVFLKDTQLFTALLFTLNRSQFNVTFLEH